MTGLDIGTDAMVACGELGQGQQPSAEDGFFVLARLNGILDSWSQDEAYLFKRDIAAYDLVQHVGSYAIGPTAAAPFNVTRPTKIDMARIMMLVGGFYVGIRDLRLISYEEFVSHSDKSSESIVPEELYYDNAMPNGNLTLFDIPSVQQQMKLELTTWAQLQQFESLASVYNLPPGYIEPLTLALCEAISPGYNKPLDPVTAGRTATYTERLKSINRMILRPGMPPASALPQGQG